MKSQNRETRAVLVLAAGMLLAACTPDAARTQNEAPRLESAGDRGLALAQANGCIACHSLDGARGVGPSWKGIYGEMVTLTDGRSVVVDEAYLRRAILEPGVEVVEGYQNLMVPPSITDAQVADIIAFIDALRKFPLNDPR